MAHGEAILCSREEDAILRHTNQVAVGQLKAAEESAKWNRVCWVAICVMVALVWWAHRTELASTLASGAQTAWPMVGG